MPEAERRPFPSSPSHGTDQPFGTALYESTSLRISRPDRSKMRSVTGTDPDGPTIVKSICVDDRSGLGRFWKRVTRGGAGGGMSTSVVEVVVNRNRSLLTRSFNSGSIAVTVHS